MVGKTLKNYFEKKGFDIFLYDKEKNLGSPSRINLADIIFICVPTPYKEGEGLSLEHVEKTCKNLDRSKIIVIKSTVLPKTTEKLQKKYKRHKFLFNPEFLVEARAKETTENPERQIVGYTEESKDFAERIMKILPEAPYQKIMPATEAEMVKCFGNCFLATKVIFANQFFDICKSSEIDYDSVKEAVGKDSRIGMGHLEIFHAGYRGYGGKCLPKDVKALIEFCKKSNLKADFLKKIEEINNRLMKDQGIDDPEKYSERNPY